MNGNTDMEHDAPRAKKQKTKPFDLPTKEEQLHLRETENLMKSNILTLQITELLAEVDATSHKKTVDAWIATLLNILNSIKVKKVTTLDAQWLQKEESSLSLSEHGGAVSLNFQAPVGAQVIGSHAVSSGTAPYTNIDILVTMPDTCFDKRDILNHVYFDKKKLYLAYLARVLSDKTHRELMAPNSLRFAHLKGDERKPILHLTPNIKLKHIPTAGESVFNPTQLLPTKNNIRPLAWIEALQTSKTLGGAAPAVSETALPPTPAYNMAILEDITCKTQQTLISKAIAYCPAIREAIILLKVWLHQIGSRYGYDGLDGHTAALISAFLLQCGLVNTTMSSLTIMLCTLKFLADTSYTSILCFVDMDDATRAKYSLNLPATILLPVVTSKEEVPVFYNILWRWSASAVTKLQEEAASALYLLQSDDATLKPFESVFLTKVSFFQKYDMFFTFPLLSTDTNEMCETSQWQRVTALCHEKLVRGLGNRAKQVTILSSPRYNDDSSPESARSAHYPFITTRSTTAPVATVTIGVILDSDHSHRRVDRGPSATDEAEVAAFVEFWGPRAQLRRFKDGSIVMAMVWGSTGTPRGEVIVQEIVSHLLVLSLQQYCGEAGEQIRCVTNQLETCLPESDATLDDSRNRCRRAIEALDSLRSLLTSDELDIPLLIDSLSGAHPALRYTSFLPPSPHPVLDGSKEALNAVSGEEITGVVPALTIVANLQRSSKWPNDIIALRHVKTAFILQLAKCLENKHKIRCVVHREYLDVFQRGFLFRLHLHTDHEQLMLENSKDPSDHIAAAKIQRSLVLTPMHHAAVHAMQSRHVSYSNTVRMLQYWVAGHMLTGHIEQETMELLVASVFIECDKTPTLTAPCTATAGFLRVLTKIAEFDWEASPLFVDFLFNPDAPHDRSLESSYEKEMEKFDAHKSSSEGSGMIIYAAYDKMRGYVNAFGTENPSKSILRIIRNFAKTSVQRLLTWMSSDTADEETMLIMKPFDQFPRCNVVLQFHKGIIVENSDALGSLYLEAVETGPPAARMKVFSNTPVAGLAKSRIIGSENPMPHPLQFDIVKKLVATFGHIALFFWNHLAGDKVFIVWKAPAFTPAKFSVLQSSHVKVCETQGDKATLSEISPQSVVAEMLVLGDGLIEDVQFC